jgi:DNA polymerase sigma
MISNLKATLSFGSKGGEVDLHAMILIVVGLLIVAAPLELGQLAFAFVGALCYAALQASRKVTHSKLKKADSTKGFKCKVDDVDFKKPRTAKTAAREKTEPGTQARAKREVNPAGKQEYRQASAQPVSSPSFSASDFGAQVEELVSQIAPSAEGDKLVSDISVAVKAALNNLIPEAEVMGFASGDVLRGTAFAVAIPEVDIILSATPSSVVERLRNRASRPLPHASKLDARKLQKSMLRACTDELTAVPGFKFRRSAFKGQEPKVTLMAEINGKTVPIDFSVNTTTPLYNAALLTECGQIDPRAKELILLVRRWAKDRGVSHAAKGHVSPYAWSLLVIYFLQVWDGQGEPVLPNITSFKVSSGLLRQRHKQPKSQQASSVPVSAQTSSVACLFEQFMRFYTKSFDWRSEAVSVRAGARKPPSVSLPLHIVTLENGSTDVAPSVEDPFEPRRNLSDAMTGISLGRLREELARASDLLTRCASLSELVEPWVPPEQNSTVDDTQEIDEADA